MLVWEEALELIISDNIPVCTLPAHIPSGIVDRLPFLSQLGSHHNISILCMATIDVIF